MLDSNIGRPQSLPLPPTATKGFDAGELIGVRSGVKIGVFGVDITHDVEVARVTSRHGTQRCHVVSPNRIYDLLILIVSRSIRLYAVFPLLLLVLQIVLADRFSQSRPSLSFLSSHVGQLTRLEIPLLRHLLLTFG